MVQTMVYLLSSSIVRYTRRVLTPIVRMSRLNVLSVLVSAVCGLVIILAPSSAAAQTPDAPPPPPARPTETELNTINLPTTLSLKTHHSYFRLTHRYSRDWSRGDFGQLAASLFGLDDGATIGLEYRFGITSYLQAGIHRSLDNKTIETFAKWDAIRQKAASPVSVSVTASVEGLNNLRELRQPGLTVTVGRTFGDRLAVYASPAFVGGTHAVDAIGLHDHDATGATDEHANHSDTWFAGFGARLRFSPTGYIVGEYTPRVGGYDPNANQWGIAIEKWTRRGHTLQLNFSNSFGTTPGQIARGGNSGQVYLGFNITRKF
jgi:hypothetical protein